MIERPTVCGFCSCGCALYVEPSGDAVAALCPSANHPVASGRLCIKGWNATAALRGAERLRTPLVRKGEDLQPASWEEAIGATVEAVKKVASESGPQSIGVIGSAKTTNEESYSLSKLARAVIGTPNIDGSCRFYDASLIPALLETTGLPASQADINSISDAGSMLIVGANVMEQLAHVGSRIEEAAANGCKIIAADPRTSRLSPHTSMFLHPYPGTDLGWTRALLKTVISRKLYTDEASAMAGFEELVASLEDVDLQRIKADTGADYADLTAAADMLAANPPLVVMFGLGVLQQSESVRIAKALADLTILLGGTVMPLRGQNNAQGACDMGVLREYLPGYASVSDSEARAKWEKVWGRKLPDAPGKSAGEMLQGCASGEIRAMLVFGENVVLSAPDTEKVVSALDTVGFLAVADLYLTETAELADVVFPACSFLEKDGTFTSIERRVQRVRKVFEPLGESRSDLDITADLAAGLGGALDRDPSSIMKEIAAAVPQYEGVSYELLDMPWGPCWPSNGITPRLAPIPSTKPDKTDEYPLRLIASRIHFHQQTGTMASRTGVLSREYPEAFVEMNESDAEKWGLKPGSVVRVISKAGSLERTMILGNGMPPGCIHVPHYFGGNSPNALASQEYDAVSCVPVYKGCAVRVEAAK